MPPHSWAGWSLALLLAAASPHAMAQTPDVPADPVILMRQHWLDSDINAFNFRHSAEMFETRKVARSGPVRALPMGKPLAPPSYTFEGKTRTYDEFARRTYTNAMLVMRDGQIIFEDYRNNSQPTDRFVSFSMAKSITSLLVGLAHDRGAIASLDDPAGKYVPELNGGAYGDVSIRHILQMRSGVAYEERYDFGATPSLAARIHMNAIVANKERFADSAKTIARAAPPGSRFNYATLDTAVLGWVVERATKQPLAQFTADNLWGPAGMEDDGLWIADGPPGVGRELSGMGFNARLRDYARLGQLMLDGGLRDGKQVLPKGWMQQATTMIPFDTPTPFGGRGYGFQFWQLDGEPGAYSALGLAGQFIYVHPATRTVIVKLSHFPQPEPANVMPETLAYFKAITSR
jgi:CubicO group peptidase (beta-lactamase class C family)